MSHQPKRKEKNCLNCDVSVAGRYCQNCGQENIVLMQTAWGLVTHFVYDIFHFDGKFFHTLKYLLFRPGFVPRECISGKRMRYLDPIRMYLFTSAVFFLVFFAISLGGKNFVNFTGDIQLMTKLEPLEYASVLPQQIFLITELNKWLEWGFLTFLAVVLFLLGGVYLYIPMRRFYGQEWFKNLYKFL